MSNSHVGYNCSIVKDTSYIENGVNMYTPALENMRSNSRCEQNASSDTVNIVNRSVLFFAFNTNIKNSDIKKPMISEWNTTRCKVSYSWQLYRMYTPSISGNIPIRAARSHNFFCCVVFEAINPGMSACAIGQGIDIYSMNKFIKVSNQIYFVMNE